MRGNKKNHKGNKEPRTEYEGKKDGISRRGFIGRLGALLGSAAAAGTVGKIGAESIRDKKTLIDKKSESIVNNRSKSLIDETPVSTAPVDPMSLGRVGSTYNFQSVVGESPYLYFKRQPPGFPPRNWTDE